MNEKEEFAISEAKDFLKDLNASISKTRDKSWQLLAFIIAVDVYLIQQLLQKTDSNKIISISILSFIFSILILFKLNKSMFPIGFFQNGGHPDKLKKLIKEENNDAYFPTIMQTYQDCINENDIVLKDMITDYKCALKLIYTYVISSLFICILILFIEGNQ